MYKLRKAGVSTQAVKSWIHLKADHLHIVLVISFVEPLECLFSLAQGRVNFCNRMRRYVVDAGQLIALLTLRRKFIKQLDRLASFSPTGASAGDYGFH